MKPVVLVDVKNLAYRAHFAFKELKTRAGFPTSVLYGFPLLLQDVKKLTGPADFVFCWDGEDAKRWRCALWPEYKLNRKPNPDAELVSQQLPHLRRFTDALGHKSIQVTGLEADDLISLAAEKILSSETVRVMIYSNDSDLWQLLEERLTLVQPTGQGGCCEITTEMCIEKFNVKPGHIASFKALSGDSSDNYKPIAGFGPVKAATAIRSGIRPRFEKFSQHKAISLQEPLLSAVRENWDRVHTCFKLALLPRTLEDSRIAAHAKDARGALDSIADRARVFSGKAELDMRREEVLKLLRTFELDSQMSSASDLFRDVVVFEGKLK